MLYLLACVTLARGAALCHLWALSARHRRGVRRFETDLDLQRLATHLRLLAAWFARSRRRPRYSRREWLLILEYAHRFGLTPADIARDFFVSLPTAYRRCKDWRYGVWRDESGRVVPNILPCTRIADRWRAFILEMANAGGNWRDDRAIARHLEHQGEKISPRAVGRIRNEGRASEAEKNLLPPREEVIAAADLMGPKEQHRPRVARLVRTLADAFTEGIARDTLMAVEDDVVTDGASAILRTRRTEQLLILLARLGRIPPRKRPHYTDAERADILAFKCRFHVPNALLAEWFLVDRGTLSAWADDVDRPEQRKHPLVRPLPDLAAAVAEVTVGLPSVPKRLQAMVEETLRALASKVPVKRRRFRKAAGSRTERTGTTRGNLVGIEARSRNHYWTSDLSILTVGGQDFYLAAIQDLFSRHVLVWDLFPSQPDSEQVALLFDEAVARFGAPAHFVSDQGGQFIGEAMRDALARHGVDPHHGAIGQHGSIAIIERTWRTIKEGLNLKYVRTQVPDILRERVAVVIDYYSTKRPHMALGGATPAEVYRGEESRAASAQPVTRGWRGQDSPPVPFAIRYAFPAERRLPYLERVA